MCGICGKINLDFRPVDEALLRRMAASLSHRGPDGEGIYLKNNVGLGHRRLKIIDLSDAASQPMSNEDGSVWIVYNGEIYNFLELKSQLQQKGHILRSRSDTEVIVHLYEEYGIGCVKFLRGMFAFAVWDEKQKKLFLARDRLGKKPLKYAFKNGSFIFASEIKAILEDPDFSSSSIDTSALDLYLTYQYVPSPRTIFSEIKKLPPAHILTLEAGRIKIERYWSLSYRTINKISETEYCRRIQDELAEATRIRLMSDVPLGAFLSGGIDSSAVVAMMSRFSAKPVKTFSIGFREHSFNELKYARKIAKIFGAEHREYTVTPNALDVLPKLIRHFDEPFADSSAIPTYYLSQMTRQEVAVALNGDGGDESFAGYERYAAAKISGRYSRLPYSLRRVVASSVRNLPESTRKKDFIKSLKRFTGASLLSAEKRYFSWMFLFSPQAKNHLYSGDFKVSLGKMDCGDYLGQAYSQSAEKEPLSSLLAVDVLTYLPEDLLVKVDIAAMANSLEARSPFLDHKLMEFAASIPANLKLKGISTKPLLKKALAGILPRDILARKKYGFGVPVGSWFRHQLKDYAYEILLSPRCLKRGYFRKESIKSLLDEHTSAKFDHGQRIWGLLNLELWHQIFREK